MSFKKRTFQNSASSVMNLNPKTDYRSYTSVNNATGCKAAKRDMKNVTKDFWGAVSFYESTKKAKCTG